MKMHLEIVKMKMTDKIIYTFHFLWLIAEWVYWEKKTAELMSLSKIHFFQVRFFGHFIYVPPSVF